MGPEKAKTGPAKSTRAQMSKQNEKQKQQTPPTKTADCLSIQHGTSTWEMTPKDHSATLPCIGRCIGVADESIVSPRLAESVILSGIGKFKKIYPVTMQVALKEAQEAQSFTF